MRAILLTLLVSCFLNAVGVADKDIVPNGKMTASSIHPKDSFASYARLRGNEGYGWCSYECCESDEWLQVDIGRTVEICGIATQGSPKGQFWVEDFKFSYSTDGSSWTTYQDPEGTEMVRWNYSHIVVNKNKQTNKKTFNLPTSTQEGSLAVV